jgi:hypothetical protein
MTTTANRRSIFDPWVRTVARYGVRHPEQAHAVIARARQQAAIALRLRELQAAPRPNVQVR